MNNIPFIKGDFITQSGADNVFAIWDGEEYPSEDKSKDYSLIAYCDPTNMEEDTNAHGFKCYVPKPIISIGLNGQECDYVICEDDLSSWKKCSQDDINKILQFLAEKGYKWDMDLCELRKLGPNEKLIFSDSPKQTPARTTFSTVTKTYGKVTILKNKWERQTVPIVPMGKTKLSILKKACNTYNEETYSPRRYNRNYRSYQRPFVNVNSRSLYDAIDVDEYGNECFWGWD